MFDTAQNAWIEIDDLFGHSRRIAATPHSYDHLRLGHGTDGYFVFEVGGGDFGRTLLRLNLDAPLQGGRLGDFLDRIVDIWLVNGGAAEAIALFDWVGVSGGRRAGRRRRRAARVRSGEGGRRFARRESHPTLRRDGHARQKPR